MISVVLPCFNEEASILGFDAINFRDSHERPESTEEGSTFFIGINKINYANL